MDNNSKQYIPGARGFNARVLREDEHPKPIEETKKADAPSTVAPDYQGHARQYPESRRGDQLLPSFGKFSKTLDVSLERERKEREAIANEALGIDPEIEKARTNRARIAALVQSGEMTEERAAEMWRNLHPNLSPEDVR